MPTNNNSLSRLCGELKSFSDTLQHQDFKAISPGLGLGRGFAARSKNSADTRTDSSNSFAVSSSLPLGLTPQAAVLTQKRKKQSHTNQGFQPLNQTKSQPKQLGFSQRLLRSTLGALSRSFPAFRRGNGKNNGQNMAAKSLRFLLGHAFDLMIVLVIGLLTVLAAIVLLGIDQGQHALLTAITWISAMGTMTLLSGIYAIFIAYALVFKFLVGTTIGFRVFKKHNLKTNQTQNS